MSPRATTRGPAFICHSDRALVSKGISAQRSFDKLRVAQDDKSLDSGS